MLSFDSTQFRLSMCPVNGKSNRKIDRIVVDQIQIVLGYILSLVFIVRTIDVSEIAILYALRDNWILRVGQSLAHVIDTLFVTTNLVPCFFHFVNTTSKFHSIGIPCRAIDTTKAYSRSQFSRCRDASSRLMVIRRYIFDHFLPCSVQSGEFHFSRMIRSGIAYG